MKIMVCHDGSKDAQNALDQVITMFKPQKPEILLLTVVEGGSDASMVNEEIFEKARAEGHDFLQKTSKDIARHGFDVDAILAVGDPRKMITEAVGDKKPDILVIAKRGGGILENISLGSVSAYVVRHVKCPVLVFH